MATLQAIALVGGWPPIFAFVSSSDVTSTSGSATIISDGIATDVANERNETISTAFVREREPITFKEN